MEHRGLTTAWAEKTVKRYYWNGKGYHSKASVCKAIAKKEAVIWCATHFSYLFDPVLPKLIATNAIGKTRTDASWMTALAFCNIGSNGDNFYYGQTLWAFDQSPWQQWIKRRVNHLLAGDEPLIKSYLTDEDSPFRYEWEFTKIGLAVVHGLPLASIVDKGRQLLTTDEVIDALRELWGKYSERYQNMGGYENFCLFSPLDMLMHRMEGGQ